MGGGGEGKQKKRGGGQGILVVWYGMLRMYIQIEWTDSLLQ